MFDLESCLSEQLRTVMTTKQTLIFPEGDDPRVLQAASELQAIANIIVVVDKQRARRLVEDGGVELACSVKRFFTVVRFVDLETEPLVKTLAPTLAELSVGKKWQLTTEEAEKQILDSVYFSIMAVREGYADAVLGGLAHSSRSFFMPSLRILDKEDTVYEMAIFALPDEHPNMYQHNLVMFADVALNPIPSADALADIAIGASRTMRDIMPEEVLPEINTALLSYSTRGSGQGPSVERIRGADPLIAERLSALKTEQERYRSINIITEMQISVALSESAARTKLGASYHGLKGAGRANVLVVPSLDVGNLLYHIYATRYPDASATLIIGGLHNQALDFSRSSTAEELTRGAKALLLRRYRSHRYARTPNDYFFPRYRILTVNPGSTSTKVAVFEGEDVLCRRSIRHAPEQFESYASLTDQLPLRLDMVRTFLDDNSIGAESLHAIVGRGGLLRPIESGTYRIDNAIAEDLRRGVSGEHPSNLGGLIARDVADSVGIPSFIVDPPVVDELDATARLSGYVDSQQEAAWHALSQKSAAKLFAEQHNREYEDLNLIVGHLGGGISVGSHRLGRCVKVKNALYDGPMTPNRAGTLPGADLIDLCMSGLSREEIVRRLVKRGGLISYLGTDDLVEVEALIAAGDSHAALVFEGMVEQIGAEIASHVPKFKGETIDQIVLTGGLCHSDNLRQMIRRDLSPLGIAITIYPGEREMEALRDGGLRVLRGMEQPKPYKPLRDEL